MEICRVKRGAYDAFYREDPGAARNLLVNNRAYLPFRKDARYGIIIENNSKFTLYPYLLYFNPSDYSITVRIFMRCGCPRYVVLTHLNRIAAVSPPEARWCTVRSNAVPYYRIRAVFDRSSDVLPRRRGGIPCGFPQAICEQRPRSYGIYPAVIVVRIEKAWFYIKFRLQAKLDTFHIPYE
jgi:hypothetical protein